MENAGNVSTGANYGIINMESVIVQPADDFMDKLSARLNISKRADHRYYAPDNEASLRRGQCTPGTHVNILHGITHWATNMLPNGERVFWLSGQAGAGKTTIAYTVACRLEIGISDGQSNVKLGASFFWFPDTKTASSIVRTIVYQLALRSKSFQEALKKHGRFDTVDHGPKAQLMGLLAEPWGKSASERLAEEEPCYIISIDALDELERTGGTEFLGTLFDIVEQQDLSGIKFFVTSRSHPVLVKRMESFSDKRVCRLEEVPLEETSADIRLYLNLNLAGCATPKRIQQLVSEAGGLFIYAATVVEFVKDRGVEEQKSVLNGILSTSSPAARRRSRGVTATLDDLYVQILETCLVDPRDRNNPDVFQDCLSILHTFLCTIDRTSPSVAVDILNASSGDGDAVFDAGVAQGVLHRLHAVLYSQGGKVMFFHKSFSDFLFDKGRSQRFFCDQEQHHRCLIHGCFGVMKAQLSFNIADIPSSYLMDCDNPTLPTNIDSNISPSLRYACGNWNAHLMLTSPRVEPPAGLTATLYDFLQLQILFWMESMNLLGQRGRCQGMLRDAQRWSSKSKDPKELVGMLADAAAFSAYHSTSEAALSTPHLYLSSLATFPRRSAIVQSWKLQLGGIPGFIGPHGVGGEAVVTCITFKRNMTCLAVSPDGVRIMAGSCDVHIWDLSTGKEVSVLKGHTRWINAVSYSPDGTHAISGSSDNSVRVWNLSTGEEVLVLNGHTGWVNAVSYSPDATQIVSGSHDRSVRVWDASTGEALRVLEGHTGKVVSVSYSPVGTHLVSGSDDGSVRVWDLSTGKEVRFLRVEGHTDAPAVSCSPDGIHVASTSLKSIRVWDVSTGEQVRVLKGHTSWASSVAYSPDGTHVVAGSADSSISVWDASTGEVVRVLKGRAKLVAAVSYSPDGTHVVSVSQDNSIRVWDLSAGEEAGAGGGHTTWGTTVAYSPDGSQIVSTSEDHSLHVLDLSTGEEVAALAGHTQSVNAVSYSLNGTHIVSGSSDRSVLVWDLALGGAGRVLEGHTDSVSAVAFSPAETHIVSGSYDCSIRVWDLSTGVAVRVLEGHFSWVWSVSCSPNGNNIISGSDDELIRVWDLTTGEELRVLKGHDKRVFAVSYSPDGTHVVSGSGDRSVRVWDVSTGQIVRVFKGHTGWVTAVSCSPDGNHPVSGSDDETIRTWDLRTGEVVKVLRGHTDMVKAVSYSPNRAHVASASHDKTIRVWDISPEHSPRYIREQGPDGKHTGWLVSPTDPSAYLMFIRPDALLTDDSNFLTLPATAVPHLELSNAKLGDRWAECYTPRAL